LLADRGGDLTDAHGAFFHHLRQLVEVLARFLHLQEASLHLLATRLGDADGHSDGLVGSVENLLNAVGGLNGLIGQAADLACDDRESFSVLTRPNGLDRRVQGEHVGLVSDLLNHLKMPLISWDL